MAKGSIFVHVNVNIRIIWIFVFQARDVPRCYFWKKKIMERKANLILEHVSGVQQTWMMMKWNFLWPYQKSVYQKRKPYRLWYPIYNGNHPVYFFSNFCHSEKKQNSGDVFFRCFIPYNSVRYQKLSFRFLQYRTTIHNRLFPSSQLSPHTNIVSSQIPT